MKKLKMQVVQTGEAINRQEALIKGKGEETLKHHVIAIIDNDLWQVVKPDKLQESTLKLKAP